ncbi:type IX secretion system sortase PorU [Echinicola soli]|uniref:Type IX secretion system sortase PorU n=1 Tax=Echinicola soli TaxID=2591634 RepID=A0A514CJG8_9BACT|nr:type IX secretion system sortase PorU [Echinicola soli]QDH79972.1 type IX secretion system sortase PorU [Echinicola soli]
MKLISDILKYTLFTCLALLEAGDQLFAQSSYYKFPITQSGIYQLSAAEVPQLNGTNLEKIAFYGSSGMLPQKLEEGANQLQELPSLLKNDRLYVYLEGPHQLSLEDDSLQYIHHTYTDTAYYLIKTNVPSPKRVTTIQKTPPVPKSSSGHSLLYSLYPYKKEELNLLSSGRKWYGNRVRAGGIASFNIHVDSYHEGPIYYQANLMAQSTSTAALKLRSQQNEFFTISIPAIPPSTYGLKGREKSVTGFTEYVDVGNPTQFNIDLESSDPNAVGFLDHFLLGLPHNAGQIQEGIYINLDKQQPVSIGHEDGLLCWDITHFEEPFTLLDENGKATLAPFHRVAIAKTGETPVINQLSKVSLNLRQINAAELVVITAPSLLFQANKLADFKRSIGISTAVVTAQDIYDSYNYGTRDVTAIRNFLADQYHLHKTLQNVLFFGKGTFDYKNISAGRPNLVPTYSSRNSLHPLTSFSSDDYFGFLEFGQGEWQETEQGDLPLSIGVGRIPVINFQEARNVVEKIIQYETQSPQLGKWKRQLLFVADDGDQNIHLNHSETHTSTISQNSPAYDVQKLYLDAFEQIDEGSFQTAPEAKAALAKSVEDGLLLINYIGHGNENTLAAERIFQVNDLQDWPETKHFPLIVTATCEFGRHDSPYLRSGAEELLMAKNKGAIALLTTGRPVFSSINFELNKAFITAIQENGAGKGLQLGDIFKATKNNSLNGPYNRNFSLLGDPSLCLARPELTVDLQLLSPGKTPNDSLFIGQKSTIKGSVLDPVTTLPVDNFQGTFLLEILGEPTVVKTNGDEGAPGTYQDLNNILYRGTGTVTNGHFTADLFISPQTTLSRGTIRVFASSSSTTFEAMQARSIPIGHAPPTDQSDQNGPIIRLFANDTTNSPATTASTQITFIASLKDKSGIQTASGKDQDISLQVNGHSPIILNDHYHAINSNYSTGIIEMPLDGLEEGMNTLELTAYDNFGNSSTQVLKIKVQGSENLRILKFINYPNPTNDISYFKIKHNRPDESIIFELTIYNLLGQEIFSMEKRYPKASTEITDIEWIFLRDMTKIPAKGTYIYELQLTSERDGTSDQAIGKINIQ